MLINSMLSYTCCPLPKKCSSVHFSSNENEFNKPQKDDAEVDAF